MKTSLCLISISFLVNNITAEDIYQYTDENGATVFTNKAVKNAKKVALPPLNIYASPMTKTDYHAHGYTSRPSQKKIPPRVEKKKINGSFATNEAGRQQILNEELRYETQALADTKLALETAKRADRLPSEKINPRQYQIRLQALSDAITEHKKNIQILSQQLGNN